MSLSFLDVAYEILKIENKPLSSKDIVIRARKAGILKTKGKTPGVSLNVCLHNDIYNKGANSRFLKIGKGEFGLIGWAERYDIYKTAIRSGKVSRRSSKKQTSGFTEILDDRLLSMFKNEMREIRFFIRGKSNPTPSADKLCFWVWFCYLFGLYREGALIFRKIDRSAVTKDLFGTVEKIGLACEARLGR
jgi:DNA-directed RNA polymerase delta subunit